ncbi:doublecortin domain-containing protein 2 isoform X2 [Gallus gallus]|uniref:Doublecortin domain-containing protein 2 n=1 Tax=Gallus gallus TaxID=9031 RepID=A0A8V0XR95_CHICK|nr:doublecortin domain-containing protein 2 isoform X2 [Gallus gallus]XP_040519072.1 doublecortin domain-containing protein 2 isoform X2 [Gallus gallus]
MTNPGTKGSFLSQPMVKSVLVYRNGDPFFPGRRIVINEKKVSNFEVFLKEVTGGVKAPFGAVRNIYTPRAGHRVRQLEELQSGEQYVAGGREAFKKLNYLDIGETKKKPAEANNEVKPVTHSRITASARFRKPLQEPYTIFLIANGDLISPVVRLLIPRKTLNHWDHILEMVTAKVSLRSGAVHRLYTLDGKHVQNGSDLEKGQFYVAVGREKFKKLPYGELLFSKSTIRPQGSKASVLPPIAGSRKSKGSGNDRQSKSTVASSDPGEKSSSPQPPKEKVKKCHNPEDSTSRGYSSNKSAKVKQTASTGFLQDNGEGIYRASEKRPEMWGAAEVQEDEDTRVEVPLDQRPAETVDEEENAEEENDREEEEAYKQKEEYPEVNGEESGETVTKSNREGENKNKLNGNYEHETENVDQAEEEDLIHLNGKINEENGEGMEQMNSQEDLQHEEDVKEDYSGSQNQVDSHHEKPSRNPRVTITSPQESEKKDQSNDYAVVA